MIADIDNKSKQLDQFYTCDAVASLCLSDSLDILNKLGYSDDVHFLEPSAGDGAFIRALTAKGIKSFSAYDIDVKQRYIKQNDFLDSDIADKLPKKHKVINIGNPPFGKRAKLAIGFMNKAFTYSETVAFILPLQFNKYSAQKPINSKAKLVYNRKLDSDSFMFNGEKYSVRCCLQIWTTRQSSLPDLRITAPPLTKHQDFEMWQYNNTREAEKYLNKAEYGWDFAVPRQGYKDYRLKETDPTKLNKRTQWIFFKANNNNVLERLYGLDFEKLSKKNISIPGFGKADVIEEYMRVFGRYDDNSEVPTVIHTFQLGDPSPSFADALSLSETL